MKFKDSDCDFILDTEELRLFYKKLIFYFEKLNDEKFVSILDKEYKEKNEYYPTLALWRVFMAMIFYKDKSILDYISFFNMNYCLAYICGIKPKIVNRDGKEQLNFDLPEDIFFNFVKIILKHVVELREVFSTDLEYFTKISPKFIKKLMKDGNISQIEPLKYKNFD